MIKTTRTTKPDGSFEEVSTMQQSSIEISKNAKGDVAYSVKVYEDEGAILEEKLKAFTELAEKRKAELLGK